MGHVLCMWSYVTEEKEGGGGGDVHVYIFEHIENLLLLESLIVGKANCRKRPLTTNS